MNIAYNCDCLEYMKTLPDKCFDLSCVDPPYADGSLPTVNLDGDGERASRLRCHGGDRWDRYSTDALSKRVERTGGQWAAKCGKDIIAWDVAPPKEYFDELFRISKNVIIWGGNYFDLPPTRCFLVWRKLTISEDFTMAMAEYAWTSFNENAKVFEFAPQGKRDDPRFHPTQKPIELYSWIFSRYAKQGDKIFDSHLGSGSSRIAAHMAGLDFVGCEINEIYYKPQEERFEQYTAQMSLFT